MDPLVGRELEGRYRLLAPLGEGAMGRVYRAERLDGSGLVAIKVLNEDCSEQQDLRERFEREARALFGLAHPHILDVQDYGVLDGRQPFLVMELLSGRTLEAMVEESSLHPDLALELGRQFLSGLAFAHAQGVLHRDLKAENIFVVAQPDGRLHAKLLDFGLVKFVDDDRWGEGRKLTVVGSVMGSPAYMSPEQATGGAIDARSDVYSAGVVLYELLTGTWPFVGESRAEMLKAHLLEPVPSLSKGRSDLGLRPELDAVLQRAMAKEVAARFADAGQMLAALEAVPRPPAWLAAPAAPSYGGAGQPPVGSDWAPQPLPFPAAPLAALSPAHAPTPNSTPVRELVPQRAAHVATPRSIVPWLIAALMLASCLVSVVAGAVWLVLMRSS